MKKNVEDLVKGNIVISSGNIYKIRSVEEGKYGAIVYGQRFYPNSNRWSTEDRMWNMEDEIEVFKNKNEAQKWLSELLEYLNRPLPFFVYGTLRVGQGNYQHYFRGRTINEISGTINGEMYERNIPYLFEGNEICHGDVLWVAEENYSRILDRVDNLEGFRPFDAWSHYTRKEVEVTLSNGESIQAWCYFCADNSKRARNGLRKVPNNDYNLLYPPYFTNGGE